MDKRRRSLMRIWGYVSSLDGVSREAFMDMVRDVRGMNVIILVNTTHTHTDKVDSGKGREGGNPGQKARDMGGSFETKSG